MHDDQLPTPEQPTNREPLSSESTTIQPNPKSAAEVGNQALATSKDAVFDTWVALKRLRRDPSGDLQSILDFLGDDRAFKAGIVLCLTFVISVWLVIQRLNSDVFGLFNSWLGTGFGIKLGFEQHLQILLFAFVPIVLLLGIFVLCKKLLRTPGNYRQFTFTTAITVLPITVFLLIAAVLGFRNGELISILSLFCSTTIVLFLHQTLVSVLKLSVFLVPTILLILLFVSAKVYAFLLSF
jgi:hypothetical protein